MNKLIESIGNFASKYGLFPAVAILSLIIGGYGCYTAQINAKAIQSQAVDLARLEARLDANTEKLSERMGSVERALIEMTAQFKLFMDGKLIVNK